MKKLKISIVLILLVSILSMLLATNVEAATKDTLLLGVRLQRSTGKSFKTQPSGNQEAKVWKIVSYPYTDSELQNGGEVNISGRNPDYSNLIYCLKAEKGFANTGTESSNGLFYYYKYNMLDKNNYTNIQNILEMDNDAYKKLLWVLNNMYVPVGDPTSNEAQKRDLLTKAFTYSYVGHDNIEIGDIPTLVDNSGLTDEYIEVIQQLVIWKFTNPTNPKYNGATLPTILMRPENATEFKSLADIFNDPVNDIQTGTYLQDDCSALFKYLTQNANANTDFGTTTQQPVTNTTTGTVTMLKQGDRLIVGPYSFSKNTDNYTVNSAVIDSTGRGLDYTLLDSNKQNLGTKDLKQVIGKGNFYISVPYEDSIQGVKLTAQISYSTNTNFKLYTTSQATYRDNQPVVLIEKGQQEYNIEVPLSQKLDLALRKFITKVNNVDVNPARVPQVDVANLTNATGTTAVYNHTKTPVPVKTGDTVLYTIRIYNEGNIPGYAKQITDHLPEGLEFKRDSQINTQNGWTNPSGDGKTIQTDKLKDTLLAEFKNGNLSHADVQVECVVTAQTKQTDTTLRNIAEITKHADKNGNENVLDRDSTPNNVRIPNYNTNQQDDDDYEDLILPGKILDLALRKFITKVNNVDVNPARVPQVNVANLTNATGTTAIYNHTKTPVPVETGDTVLYTIRIYNEGAMAGYAKQITDYLPEGLEFKENSQINTQNGWTNPSGDKKTIQTDKLKDTLLAEFKNGNLSHADVQVECVVTAQTKQADTILRNIAEITKHADEYGNETVTDRDSTPNNVTLPNYNQSQQDDDDYEDLILPGKILDLALRKFITKVNDVEINPARVPQVDVANLTNATGTTAVYTHTKTPVPVKTGDTVLYTIRVYNEGTLAGYAKQITDYLPEGLEFKENSQINTQNGWTNPSGDGKTIQTDKLANRLLTEFKNGNLDYADVQVECIVRASVKTKDIVLRNIAEITKHADEYGNETVTDRDSTPNNVILPGYNQSQQDDDDYEDLILLGKQFDLALRKFITQVNGKDIDTSRIPQVDTSKLNSITQDAKKVTTAVYNHPKTPVSVKPEDVVTFTIRVYNEGTLAGYASEIIDHLPEGLEFINDLDNAAYGWEYDDTDDSLRTVKTNYLAKETSQDNLIQAFDGGDTLDYKEVKIKCKVTRQATILDQVLTNIAEVSKFTDEEGFVIEDRDSQESNVVLPSDEELPNYKQEEIESGKTYIPGQQDDDDFEKVKIPSSREFDLALRKFIVKVDNLPINNRVPVVSKTEDGKLVYTHTKEPLEVENANIVTYKIRVYNEGNIAGYASEITDNIPEGLEFLPDHETNQKYQWKMIDEQGNETTDVTKAKVIVTPYLAKENETTPGEFLIQAFDKNGEISDTNPDYKEVEVAFKVTQPQTSDRIIINVAQVSQDTDENGDPVEDIDSTPNRDEEYDFEEEENNEDDIDYEQIKVKYFDLALKKWVTQAIITDNGKTTVTDTGHTGEENPEPVVKVELKPDQVKTATVKFKYSIKVTNEGEIAGYVKEIKDYIPQGLKFVAADNPKWKQIANDVITTDQAKDILLQPGQSTTVEVILTWINGADNMGLKVNVAEISKDHNDSNTPDIDSVPDNKKPGEDDIDEAPVILSVKTGNTQIYATLTFLILATIGGGTIIIKKYVL